MFLAAWRALSGLAAAGLAARASVLPLRDSRRAALDQRLARGELPPPGGLWLHAASVGEVTALAPLVDRLRAALPPGGLFLTTSTETGRARAAERCGAPVLLAPLDAPRVVHRFLERARPRGHVIVETELWPVRLRALARLGVPVALVSARLSPERFPRYRRARALYGPLLRGLDLLAPASREDAGRFLALGARAGHLGPIGNLKWDAVPSPAPEGELEELRESLGIARSRRWVVLGSVHPGEAAAVAAPLLARADGVPAGVLVAPRHPQRFDRLASELAAAGLSPWRASAGPAPPGTTTILVDRMGVLARLYGVAEAALVGGTLVPVGGHSPLEAAAAGCPQVAGPHVEHQRDLVAPLERAGALVRVTDARHAAEVLSRWLTDPSLRDRAGRAALSEVERRRGHADRLAACVLELLR